MSKHISSFIASKGLEAYRLMLPYDLVHCFQDSEVYEVMVMEAGYEQTHNGKALSRNNNDSKDLQANYRVMMVSDAHYKFWLALPWDAVWNIDLISGSCLGIKLDRVMLAAPEVIESLRKDPTKRYIDKISQLNNYQFLGSQQGRPNRSRLVPVFIAASNWTFLGPAPYELCLNNPELERRYMREYTNAPRKPDSRGIVSYEVPKRMVMTKEMDKQLYQVLPTGRQLKARKSKKRRKETVEAVLLSIKKGVDTEQNIRTLHSMERESGFKKPKKSGGSGLNETTNEDLGGTEVTESSEPTRYLSVDSLYREDIGAVESALLEDDIDHSESSLEGPSELELEDRHDSATCGCI